MIAKSVVVSVVTQHQQSLPARTSLLLLCRVSIHSFALEKITLFQTFFTFVSFIGFFKVCFFLVMAIWSIHTVVHFFFFFPTVRD